MQEVGKPCLALSIADTTTEPVRHSVLWCSAANADNITIPHLSQISTINSLTLGAISYSKPLKSLQK